MFSSCHRVIVTLSLNVFTSYVSCTCSNGQPKQREYAMQQLTKWPFVGWLSFMLLAFTPHRRAKYRAADHYAADHHQKAKTIPTSYEKLNADGSPHSL